MLPTEEPANAHHRACVVFGGGPWNLVGKKVGSIEKRKPGCLATLNKTILQLPLDLCL